MTKRQIRVVQKSWLEFSRIDPVIFTDVFYRQLFYKNPRLKSLFKNTNMDSQYTKLFKTLSFLVLNINELPSRSEEISKLASSHIGYRVEKRDYIAAGSALIYTLKVAFGERWNDELEDSWKEAYKTIMEEIFRFY